MKTISVVVATVGMFLIGGQSFAKSTELTNIEPGVRFGYFYSSLAPYGEWIEVDGGLHVWHPLRVQEGWRPYLVGRWMWTDDGWYWASSEPFGWATFHYGRWYYDEFYGWVWVPDDVWGPAWVEWRSNDDYIGWAPLPPYATFSVTVGIRYTREWVAPHYYWNFVTYRNFGTENRFRVPMREEYAQRLIRTTRTTGQYEIDRDHIINRGVNRNFVERRGNFRFERAEIRETDHPMIERITRDGGTQRVEVYRPSRTEIHGTSEMTNFRRGERSISLDVNRLDRRQPEGRTEPEERTLRREQVKEERPQGTIPTPSDRRPEPRVERRESTSPSRLDRIERDAQRRSGYDRPAPRMNRSAPSVVPKEKHEFRPERSPQRNDRSKRRD
jgi:hypothetical protein